VSPRRPLLAALLAAALATAVVTAASPAVAITPQSVTPQTVIPGWRPSDPPADRAALAARLAEVTYAVSCGTVTATGWSADVADDPAPDSWKAILVTTSAMSAACAATPAALRVRQGALTIEARPWVAGTASDAGTIQVKPDLPYIDWDFVPTPRVGQWVGIAARGVDGGLLSMLERRVTAVGTDSFTLNSPVDATYAGAPVVDNQGRALGVMTAAGSVVTGSPVYCGELFICTDPTKVWWDITAPSVPRDVKATAGKGRVTVTWKPALSDGGDEADYRYSVNGAPWIDASRFSITVKARKGVSVTVSVQSFNAAGWGPTKIVSARAK
jgi:hypothetical protein